MKGVFQIVYLCTGRNANCLSYWGIVVTAGEYDPRKCLTGYGETIKSATAFRARENNLRVSITTAAKLSVLGRTFQSLASQLSFIRGSHNPQFLLASLHLVPTW